MTLILKKLSAAFTYIFSDNEWFNKVLVGGFYFLLIPIGIGMIMLNGFLDDFVSRQKNGDTSMPYWRNYKRIFRQGLKKSVFSLMALGTIGLSIFFNQIAFTIPSAILILAIFLTINTIQITKTFDAFSVLISLLLLLTAISIGWMWIIVGWPLLIFLAMLVQAHLFANR